MWSRIKKAGDREGGKKNSKILSVTKRDTEVKNILSKRKKRRCRKKEQYMWQDHKKHSKRRCQCAPYGEKHRNIMAHRTCLQKMQH